LLLKPTIILFGRVPQYGLGKRRLAVGLGNLKTWQFYRQNLERTLRDLKDPRWNVKFAGTPERYSKGIRGVEFVKQGQGSLGDRLSRTFRAHKGLVLIIGTDVPDLKSTDIAQALKDIKRGNAVLGRGKAPFDDGGFWCLGLRANKCISPGLFKEVPWSHETTADRTLSVLKASRYKVVETIQHNDIDDKEGYELWKAGM
jgi:glycosyltransferase A (GT-A) superfamily protein (DUF2064 family)